MSFSSFTFQLYSHNHLDTLTLHARARQKTPSRLVLHHTAPVATWLQSLTDYVPLHKKDSVDLESRSLHLASVASDFRIRQLNMYLISITDNFSPLSNDTNEYEHLCIYYNTYISIYQIESKNRI